MAAVEYANHAGRLRTSVHCAYTSPGLLQKDLPAPLHGHQEHGFTLIELLLTVAIVAILMAIALPNYSDYIKRGRIVDGLVPLADMGARLEQYFQDHRTYVGACAAGTVAPLPAASPHFTYSCSVSNLSATASATGTGSMAGFVFTLDTNGVRKTSGTPDGWIQPGANCWSTHKNGSC